MIRFSGTVVFILCFSITIFSQKKKASFSISGKVTQSSDYCGGVEPSAEMLKQLTKSYAYSGKIFYIKRGKTNSLKEKIILSFKADTAGKFSFQLPPGNYVILQEQQLKKLNVNSYKKQYVNAEDKCLIEWWAKQYYILEIKDKDIIGLEFKFHHPCFISDDIPCLRYNGPMPP